MTMTFASIELARLYETQGYVQEALSMYRILAKAPNPSTEVQAAVRRLEAVPDTPAKERVGAQKDPATDPASGIAQALADLTGDTSFSDQAGKRIRTGPERRVADLMEKWLLLLVVKKRLKLFLKIRARF